MSDEPESLVLRMLRDLRSDVQGLRAEVAEMRGSMVSKGELRGELHSLRADVASDMVLLNAKIDLTRKELSDQIVGLRRAVVDYHTTVVGHGVLISEMEGRLRRVEQTLGLSPER